MSQAASVDPDWRPAVLVQSAGLSETQTYRGLADRVLDLGADAVICYEDYTALGLILELLARRVRVPADVAVAGFDDLPIGALPADSGKKMQFTGTTVIKVVDGIIAEEVGLDDGVTVLQQLGLIPGA
jgi:hypothetical protein